MRYALLGFTIGLCYTVPYVWAQNQSQRGMSVPKYNIRDCMVDLRNMSDGDLKRWCLKQSERMP
jgi:hypothetical protein